MKRLTLSNMKYATIVIAILFLHSCQKENTEVKNQNNDSVLVNEQKENQALGETVAVSMKDSVINNAPKTKEVLEKGVMREENDRVIIRIADGERLPFTIGEKFTEAHDKLILKITNFNKPTISATIKVKDKNQNIRFNQIKMPSGAMYGPFSKDLKYDVEGKGEVWLIIGKNNMADGNTSGDFSVTVE